MSDLPRDTGSRRYSDEHLDKLLLGDIVSEHAAPWELRLPSPSRSNDGGAIAAARD